MGHHRVKNETAVKTQKYRLTAVGIFFLLEKHLQDIDDGSRQVVFLDELPWLDTPQSGFIRAFEGFWNNWGCHRKNLMVIVCGSANSWILDKLIKSDFIIKYVPFGHNKREEHYKLIDPFCLFYLHFLNLQPRNNPKF